LATEEDEMSEITSMKNEFMERLEGLSVERVKELAWTDFARSQGLVTCEACGDLFDSAEEGGSTADNVNFCGKDWGELIEEAGVDVSSFFEEEA
jgi:hypothetical protein